MLISLCSAVAVSISLNKSSSSTAKTLTISDCSSNTNTTPGVSHRVPFLVFKLFTLLFCFSYHFVFDPFVKRLGLSSFSFPLCNDLSEANSSHYLLPVIHILVLCSKGQRFVLNHAAPFDFKGRRLSRLILLHHFMVIYFVAELRSINAQNLVTQL